MIKIHYFIVFLSQKHFPNETIFYAKSASRSFASKSILKARRVISMGAKWRVRDGGSISIYRDRWIPRISNSRVISPISSLEFQHRVAGIQG